MDHHTPLPESVFSNLNSPVRIETLSVSPRWRVSVLAPHPDDFDAVCTTLRFFHNNGNPVHVAVVSGSSSGVLDEFQPGSDHLAKSNFREQEQRDSLQAFGLPAENLRFLRLPEDDAGDPKEDEENLAAIRSVIEEQRPDLVFLPHGCDSNPGHQRVFAMFRSIVARQSRSMAAFYIRAPKTIECRLDVYCGFGEDLAEWKGGLLRLHRTQEHRNQILRGYGFDQRVLQVNRDIATEIGCSEPYAEAFEIELFNK